MKTFILSIFGMIFIFITSFSQQWESIFIDSPLQNFSSIIFTSPETGYMIGCDQIQSSWSSNNVYKTINSGKTWANIQNSELCIPIVNYTSSEFIYFLTTGSALNANNFIKTTNGGQTWNSLEAAFQNFDRKGLFFVDNNTGYYGGGDGFYIYKTIDGGLNWQKIQVNTNQKLNSVFCIGTECFVVGDSSTLLREINPTQTNVNLEDKFDFEISLYPNPTSEYMTVLTNNKSKVDNIKIIDLLGNELTYKSNKDNTINLFHIRTGTYFAIIKVGNKFYIKRFIKL